MVCQESRFKIKTTARWQNRYLAPHFLRRTGIDSVSPWRASPARDLSRLFARRRRRLTMTIAAAKTAAKTDEPTRTRRPKATKQAVSPSLLLCLLDSLIFLHVHQSPWTPTTSAATLRSSSSSSNSSRRPSCSRLPSLPRTRCRPLCRCSRSRRP